MALGSQPRQRYISFLWLISVALACAHLFTRQFRSHTFVWVFCVCFAVLSLVFCSHTLAARIEARTRTSIASIQKRKNDHRKNKRTHTIIWRHSIRHRSVFSSRAATAFSVSYHAILEKSKEWKRWEKKPQPNVKIIEINDETRLDGFHRWSLRCVATKMSTAHTQHSCFVYGDRFTRSCGTLYLVHVN